MSQLASLSGNPLKQVVSTPIIGLEFQNETSSYLVDVGGIGLLPFGFPLLLVAFGDSLSGFAKTWRHDSAGYLGICKALKRIKC